MKTERKKFIWIIFVAAALLVVILAFSLFSAFNKAYYIDFRSEGGPKMISTRFKSAGDIIMPHPPVKIGYNFDGWYYDEAFTQPFDLEELKKNRRDVVLYAKWSKEKFDVEFFYEDNLVQKTTYEYEDLITAPNIELSDSDTYQINWYYKNGRRVLFPVVALSTTSFVAKKELIPLDSYTVTICIEHTNGKQDWIYRNVEIGTNMYEEFFVGATKGIVEDYSKTKLYFYDSTLQPVYQYPIQITGNRRFKLKILS